MRRRLRDGKLRVHSVRGTKGRTIVEFAEAVQRHLAAVTGRDLDTYLSTVHDDVSLVLLNGTLVEGRAAVGEFHRDWFADPDWSWRLSPARSTTAGDTGVALVAVDYDDLDRDGRPYTVRYLLGLAFARVDGTWLLVHDQNTPAS